MLTIKNAFQKILEGVFIVGDIGVTYCHRST